MTAPRPVLLLLLLALTAAPASPSGRVVSLSMLSGRAIAPVPAVAPWSSALAPALGEAGPSLGGLGALEPANPSHQGLLEPLVLRLEGSGLEPESFSRLPEGERRELLSRARLAVRGEGLAALSAASRALEDPRLGEDEAFARALSLLRLTAVYGPYLGPGELERAEASLRLASSTQADRRRRRVLDFLRDNSMALGEPDWEEGVEALSRRLEGSVEEKEGQVVSLRRTSRGGPRGPAPAPLSESAYLWGLMHGLGPEEAARLSPPAEKDGLHSRYRAALAAARLELERRGLPASRLFFVEASAPARGPEDWTFTFFLLEERHHRWGERLEVAFARARSGTTPFPRLSLLGVQRLPAGRVPFPADPGLLAMGAKFARDEARGRVEGRLGGVEVGLRASLRIREELESGDKDLWYHFAAGDKQLARVQAREGLLEAAGPDDGSLEARVRPVLAELLPRMTGSTSLAYFILGALTPARDGLLGALLRRLLPRRVFADPSLPPADFAARLAAELARWLARRGDYLTGAAAEAFPVLWRIEEGGLDPAPSPGPEGEAFREGRAELSARLAAPGGRLVLPARLPPRLLGARLAGWAHELAARTGRPDDSWRLLRLLSMNEEPEEAVRLILLGSDLDFRPSR